MPPVSRRIAVPRLSLPAHILLPSSFHPVSRHSTSYQPIPTSGPCCSSTPPPPTVDTASSHPFCVARVTALCTYCLSSGDPAVSLSRHFRSISGLLAGGRRRRRSARASRPSVCLFTVDLPGLREGGRLSPVLVPAITGPRCLGKGGQSPPRRLHLGSMQGTAEGGGGDGF